ncbi:MAG TPA: ATP-binding cassette domain-containing protein [Synergistaceae bacterium]|nr:ATP-binding cassette domain-containing protein [Synergistaceae bacterium]HPJ24577.1 ATP-binding cassette domain-containing protein [Synergistaceae bacterium]HPQ36334.1 ATP-binding cassette domain-containing protein [Synergistaceae bacterium]
MTAVESVGRAIEVENLWKIYSRTKKNRYGAEVLHDPQRLEALENDDDAVLAVKDVSLWVAPGETFIIMGLSGSGKSTLIRCLLRLVEPTGGIVKVNGEDVTAMNPSELVAFRRRQVSMVFQHYGLLPHRTVMENVCFGLRLRGETKAVSREKAFEAIRKVGLEGWETYHPASLSGGMRQRVGIARSLVMGSPILLMDEPFSGLDPLIRRELQDELMRLQEEMKKTIFFVTHDLSEALRLGDRMAVMRDGRVVQVGTPEDIVSDPVDDYVARFVQDEREQLNRAERRMANKAAG